MSKVFGENTGKGYYKEESIDNFLKAIESSIFKAPVREDNQIYLSDLWYINSLPFDLMIEVIKKHAHDINIPEDIEEIIEDKGKKIVWKRKKNDKI